MCLRLRDFAERMRGLKIRSPQGRAGSIPFSSIAFIGRVQATAREPVFSTPGSLDRSARLVAASIRRIATPQRNYKSR
jgi:hypothetical protein